MKPQEILDELDRLKVTIWWQGLGRGPQPPVIRFDSRKVPPELAEQIRMNTAELHKIMRVERTETPGLRVRRPRTPEY
jgi:hypothetical protein